ncbi:MAG: prolyl-tRNA synthetase [Chloroflexota bacterium]|jgi:prolyl-tRNA synthetase|nr:prolyl-tRNA synthetase [Chloroflexota bacterium]
MRMSHHFGETLRAAPGDVDVVSHQLLLRAGYVRQLAAGIFSLLPLGHRAVRKLETIVREEMDAIGGQELSMPVVHPAELWQETGRWYQIGEEMARFKDRAGRDMLLGMTHEEVVTDLARRDVHSYRQLPMLIYQIQTKFRDEPRPRAGLIRVREFTMKDSYSLDADAAGLEQQYRRHYSAYFRIFSRAGLPDVISVRSDVGMMGGKLAHEFMFLNPIGEDTLVLCDACGYAANQQIAHFRKPTPPDEPARPLERVATPNASSIADLSAFLGISPAATAKVVFFTAGLPAEDGTEGTREVLVLALVRGDMEVNETKLSNALGARWLRPATLEAIGAVGAVAGYASPIGIRREGVRVVVDDLVAASPNLVSGANEAGVHYRNVKVGRDYQPDVVQDIVAAYEGAGCPECGAPVRLVRGVEVGNIFQLGTRYTEALGATFLDAEGQARPIVMGSYGIGIGRLLACLAEAHHDERGLRLPIEVAPYEVALVRLSRGEPELDAQADVLHEALQAAGVEVLYDDREVSPGVKFADADLIGMPLRATISARSLQNGGVELKRRDQADLVIVPVEGVVAAVRAQLSTLRAEAAAHVRDVPYPEGG